MSDQLFQLIVSQAWQIAVLALVVAIVTRTVAKNRPHLAHAMWLLVLIKCVTPPIWGHSLGLFSRLQAAMATEQIPAASDATSENIPLAAELTSSLVRPSLESEFHIPGNTASDLTTTRELPTTESPAAEIAAVDMSEVTATKSVEGVRRPSYSWPAILLFCVAAGAFVTLSLMIVRCVQCLRSIHRHRTTEFDDLLIERVQDLSHKLRLRRAPRVIVSDVLFGPAVLGFLRHTIVLPRCLLQSSRSCLPGRTVLSRSFLPERTFTEGEPARRAMDNTGLPEDTECTQVAASREVLPGSAVLGGSFLPERTFTEGEPARRAMENTGLPEGTECTQVAASREVLPGRQDLLFLDPILAHELLHIRRGDLRTGTLQAIVQSLWWFHPAVWLCNRWLSREAERCCDEQVIAELGCSPAQYARSLLSVIESKHQLQPVPVFPGMKPVEITSQRMERIMSLKTGLQKQTPLWCWLAVAALAIVVLPGAVAKPTTVEPKPADEEKQPTNFNTGDDSADAIRLNSGLELSGDLKPETVLAFVNNKPIRVSDVVPNPFAAGGWSHGYGKSRPMDIQTALRDRLPEFLYEELVVQHYETTVAAERQAKVLETLEKHFRQMLEVIKAHEKIITDEQLRARLAKDGTSVEMFQQSFVRDWLVPQHEQASYIPSPLRDSSDEQLAAILEDNGMSIEKLRHSYVRMAIAGEHARGLPTNSPLRNKKEIIKKCSTLMDKCSGITFFEPVLEIRDQGAVPSNAASRPLATVFPEPGDSLMRLVWETREQVSGRLLSPTDHTPWQIMAGIQGLRQDFLLQHDGKIVNGLEWIQSGPTYQGEPWFQMTEHGGRAHPFSKPYVFEGHINQFFSKLAACRLPLDATFGTADGPITIQDMVNHAKMVVNDKEEVSWTLLALCRCLPPDTKWTNAKGEEWSIEQLVQIEAGKTVGGPTSPCGGSEGLYALAVARNEYLKTGKPLEGVWLKADEKIRKYIDIAKSQQNSDGTLSSDFFRSNKRKDDFDKRLASSGHLLQFLMHAVSDEQLKEDWIRRAVEATANDIQVNRKEYVSSDPLFTATEALTTYLERVTKTLIGCAPKSPKTEETSVESLNSSTEPSTDVPVVSAEPSRDDRLILIAYNVADLIAQFKTTDAEMDFSPLVELIRTSIEPESWETGRGTIPADKKTVRGTISADKKTVLLVIRQTQTGHDGIAKILSQLRKSYDSVKVTCRLIKLTADSQLKGLEDKCSLHSLSADQRWALLTKTRSEALQKFLADEKAEVLSCPTIVTISGQPALVQVATTDGAALTGFQLSANPHLIADSSVIRLSHSVTVGDLTKDAQTAVHESLVGSGQTLLLVIEQPGKVDGRPDRFAVMLTPEHVKEEEETKSGLKE